jgi:rubrerythrin
MKKLMLFAVLGILTLSGCQSRPDKTIANLQAAVVDEATASVRYTAFASKAREEGYEPIARLFDAASRSERVHAERFKEFLDELDVKLDNFQPMYDFKSTAENLQAAIDLETRDVNSIYPKFMTDATAEKMDEVAETMGWALSAEKLHLQYLKQAQELLKASPDSLLKLPSSYSICPICGNTADGAVAVKECPNCGTDSDLFIQL